MIIMIKKKKKKKKHISVTIGPDTMATAGGSTHALVF